MDDHYNYEDNYAAAHVKKSKWKMLGSGAPPSPPIRKFFKHCVCVEGSEVALINNGTNGVVGQRVSYNYKVRGMLYTTCNDGGAGNLIPRGQTNFVHVKAQKIKYCLSSINLIAKYYTIVLLGTSINRLSFITLFILTKT